ncbi:hypothetical protein [Streptomyces sp. NPDC057509]|uniref:hypothetical protein n=1 Tax=Streptomyces sp. NPDC057509 TaxID=3346152 RepID=UPI0036AB5B59
MGARGIPGRGRLGALTGAAVLAVSVMTTMPALADESPGELREVTLPPGTEIVMATPVAASKGTSAPASADAGGLPAECLGVTASYGAVGCFQHYGDTVWSADTQADGMSSAVGVYTDYGREPAVCVNPRGVGTMATCKYDYWEKGNVQLLVMRYDGDTGTFYQPQARSSWLPVDGK